MLIKEKENSSSMSDQDTTTKSAIMFGCGNMGQALLSGWAAAGVFNWTVIDPANPDLGDLAKVLTDAKALKDTSFDLVVIAVKPQLIPVVMDASGDLIRSADLVLSIAAGVSVSTLEKQLGATPIIRMMPNMPASVGKGLSGLYPNAHCSAAHRDVIADIAAHNGEFVWLTDEDQVDRFTAIAGSGPGYIFEFLRLFTLAAIEQGFDAETARKLAIGTVAGSAEMAAQSEKSLENLRNSVTSKNGTTQAGLEQLMRGDTLKQLLSDTANAAYSRAVELR